MKYNVITVRKIAGELTTENFKDEKEMVEYFFTYLHCEDVESQLFWLNSLKDKIEGAILDLKNDWGLNTTSAGARRSGVFMNIEKLIEAAKEIDSLAAKQEARTKAWSDLARDARKTDAVRSDIIRRRRELDECEVVDFSTAIDNLRTALRGR